MGQSLHLPNEILDLILSFIDEPNFFNRHFILQMSLWNSHFYDLTNNYFSFWKERYFFLLQKLQISSKDNTNNNNTLTTTTATEIHKNNSSFQFKYSLLVHYLNLYEKCEKLNYYCNYNCKQQTEINFTKNNNKKNKKQSNQFTLNNLYSTNLVFLYNNNNGMFNLKSGQVFEHHFFPEWESYSPTIEDSEIGWILYENNENTEKKNKEKKNENNEKKKKRTYDFIEIFYHFQIMCDSFVVEKSYPYPLNENLHGCVLLFEVTNKEKLWFYNNNNNNNNSLITKDLLKKEFYNKQLKDLEKILLKFHEKKKKYNFPLIICLAYKDYNEEKEMINFCEKKVKEILDKFSLNHLQIHIVNYMCIKERENLLKEYIKIVKEFPKEFTILNNNHINNNLQLNPRQSCPIKICHVGIDVPKDLNKILEILHSEILTNEEKKVEMEKIYRQQQQLLEEQQQLLSCSLLQQQEKELILQQQCKEEEFNNQQEKKKPCCLM
ncbi:hypothetical protein ABK040_005562 [Willaertia magna]